jgi:hypothetical protein
MKAMRSGATILRKTNLSSMSSGIKDAGASPGGGRFSQIFGWAGKKLGDIIGGA